MKRTPILSTLLVFAAACGGGEPAQNSSAPAAEAPAQAAPEAAAPAASTEMTMPDWFTVDNDAKTVTMTITAGLTDAKNHWNFNGGHDGNMTITVPEGYGVTIHFKNADPVMAHSLGITTTTSGFAAMMDPTPAFPGAITQNPESMTDATMPGEEETVSFTASKAGNYAMACYIPGHAATGMYVLFNVSSDGTAGVTGAM